MMFAHQVLEDLNRIDSNLISEKDKSALIKGISISQQFHFGNVTGLHKFCGKHLKGKTLFRGELGNVRLPYKATWFDYVCDTENIMCSVDDPNFESYESSKFAMFAVEISDSLIRVAFFSWVNKFSMWIVDPIGMDINIHGEVPPVCWGIYTNISNQEYERLAEYVRFYPSRPTVLNTSLLVLSTKNIIPKKVSASQKLNGKRIKNGRLPLFDYHVLELKPTTLKEKSIPCHLWDNRVHLCRGHFKVYTPERQLFGKLVGRYWWQAQARGDKKLGVIIKDYKMKNQENNLDRVING